jgi:hypothetical protein
MVVAGSASKSSGIEVARLAGLPPIELGIMGKTLLLMADTTELPIK